MYGTLAGAILASLLASTPSFFLTTCEKKLGVETGNEAKTIPLRDELPADAGSAHQLLVALEL